MRHQNEVTKTSGDIAFHEKYVKFLLFSVKDMSTDTISHLVPKNKQCNRFNLLIVEQSQFSCFTLYDKTFLQLLLYSFVYTAPNIIFNLYFFFVRKTSFVHIILTKQRTFLLKMIPKPVYIFKFLYSLLWILNHLSTQSMLTIIKIRTKQVW